MRSWKDVILLFMFVFGMYMLIRGLIGMALADESNPLMLTITGPCNTVENMLEQVEEHEEVGVASGSFYATTPQGQVLGGDLHFFVHPTTKDYTIMFTNGEIMCALGIGEGFGPYVNVDSMKL